MRWSYLIPRLLIVLLIWGIMRFGTDPLLRYGAARSVEAVTGARADITAINTDFGDTALMVGPSQIADPDSELRNLLEFESLEVRLSPQALWRKRFVVETGRLSGLVFGSPRAESGQLDVADTEEESGEPSWLREQIAEAGSEWLASLRSDIEEQLKPEVLETYREGHRIYDKWDERLLHYTRAVKLLEADAKQWEEDLQRIRTLKPLEQIQPAAQLAQRADQLVARVRRLETEVRGLTPEVQSDFAVLNQARLNDQQLIQARLSALKPNTRRITETLIGDELYFKLQQALTWMETARDVSGNLSDRKEVDRSAGRTIVFPDLHPTPGFHVKELLVDGEFRIDGQARRFQGTLRDMTSDPQLIQRPVVLGIQAEGDDPLDLTVVYDSGASPATARIEAAFTSGEARESRVSDERVGEFGVRLGPQSYRLAINLRGNEISGQIEFAAPVVGSSSSGHTTLADETLRSLAGAVKQMSDLQATLHISGSPAAPQLRWTSESAPLLTKAFQSSFQIAGKHLQDRARSELQGLYDEQSGHIREGLASRYQELLSKNAATLRQLGAAREILVSLRSGRIQPDQVFRQASQSGILDEREQQKFERERDRLQDQLDRFGAPIDLKGPLDLKSLGGGLFPRRERP